MVSNTSSDTDSMQSDSWARSKSEKLIARNYLTRHTSGAGVPSDHGGVQTGIDGANTRLEGHL